MDSAVDFPRPDRRKRGDRELPPLPAHLSRVGRRRRILTHLVGIALPVAVALLYLLFNAADRYDVTSDFTVQPLLQSGGGNLPARNAAHLVNLAQNAAPGAYEAYMVVDYLRSPDALRTLEAKIGFLDRYRGKTTDIFYRATPWRLTLWHWFTGKSYDIPFEDRLAYYNLMVEPRYSITENIVTLDVQAFSAADAHLIAATLLTVGEDFINRTNERVLTDLVRGAESQVRQDERRLNDDHLKMQAWRGGNSDLDPDQLAAMVTQVVQGLENSLVAARSSQLLGGESGNPSTRAAAALRIKAIETQIAQEQHQLAAMEQSYAGKFYEYDRLKEDIAFAKNAYQNDLATLQTFRELAAQQEVYLLRISEPYRPDEPVYPQWALILPLTLVGGAMAYGILRMLMALGRDKWAR
jgi:capsular polysaccharide transport system permease protein